MSDPQETTPATENPPAPIDQFACSLPGVNVGPRIGDFYLRIAHAGKSPGWLHGDRSLGLEADFIVLAMSVRRKLWGLPYAKAKAGGVKQLVVCQSADGCGANGIARMLTNAEADLLIADKEWSGWHDDVKSRRCGAVTKTGAFQATCPAASGRGDEWLCRPHFMLFGLIRPLWEGSSPWTPYFWEAGGTAAKHAQEMYRQANTAPMKLRQEDGSRMPRWGASMRVELDEVQGQRGAAMVPCLDPIKALSPDELKTVTEEFMDSGLAPELWRAECQNTESAVANIGRTLEPKAAESAQPGG